MRVQIRRATAAQWTAADPVLAEGEPGLVTDTGELLLGDGVTAYTHLRGVRGSSPAASDIGLLGWTYDPAPVLPASNLVPTAGTMETMSIHMPVPATVTNLHIDVVVAGSTLTANQCKAALYQDGALLGTTGNQATEWQSTGLKTMALTAPADIVPGEIRVGVWYNGTTAPELARGGWSWTINGIAATPRWASGPTGLTTTAPASLGALTPTSIAFWAGVS